MADVAVMADVYDGWRLRWLIVVMVNRSDSDICEGGRFVMAGVCSL